MELLVKCDSCRCKPVCKEIDNWKEYCNQHIRLRTKSILFDSEPKCPYYIGKEVIATLDTKGVHYRIDDDNYASVEELIKQATINRKSKDTYKDWDKFIDKVGEVVKPTQAAKFDTDCEDEITTTVEDGLRSVGITSEECVKEGYDFVKELENIMKQNGIWVIK